MQSVEASLEPVLMTLLLPIGPVLPPPPCLLVPTNFLEFVHVLRTYPKKLMILLERLPWPLGEMAHPQGW